MEILVLHPGALGDLILSLPALRVLRERFEHARITLAANTDFAGTVATGYADQILSLSALPLHRLHSQEPIPLEDQMLWRSYDRILSWTGSGLKTFAKRLEELHPCVLVTGWMPKVGERRHVARLFMDSLHPWLSPPQAIVPPAIVLEAQARLCGAEWLREQGWRGERPVIALHPGAGSAAKRWPHQRYHELAQRLRAQAELLIIEGPAEPGLGRELAGALEPATYLASQLPLPVLTAALSYCQAFVGNDSGIAHLAAGLRIPCVVLFGPTRPEHWAPIGSSVTVLRNARTCIACEEGQNATHTCLDNLSVEMVLQNAFRILNSSK